MAIIVACPGCQQKLQVPEQSFDGMVQCPGCQQKFQPARISDAGATRAGPAPPPVPADRVPAWEKRPETVEEYERPLDEDEADDRPRKSKRKSRPAQSSGGGYYNELMRKQRKLMKPHRGVMILIFGILALSCGLIFGLMAWIMGTNDLNEIYSGRMDPTGEGLTKAGRILGMVGLGLNVAAVVLGCSCGLLGGLVGG